MNEILEKNIVRDNPFVNNKIDKKKVEKIELTVHSDVIDYFRQKSIENDIPFDVLIDRYLSKALNPIVRD